MSALRSEPDDHAQGVPARRVAIDGDALSPDLLDGLREEGLAPVALRPGGPVPEDGDEPAVADAVLLLARHGLPQRAARLQAWRRHAAGTPLIVLLAPLRELDHVLALEMGADDVLDAAWPASVVAARLRACWRRGRARADPLALPDRLVFGALAIRRSDRAVQLGGRRVGLTESEFDLLWLLASHAGRTLSRREIERALRTDDTADDADPSPGRSIDSCIYRIRAKLGDTAAGGQRIRTVRHRGYLFVPGGW